MRFGLIEIAVSGLLRFTKGANTIDLRAPAAITTSHTYTLPAALPGSTQGLQVDTSGNLSFFSITNGTVTSVAVSAPAQFAVTGSPITSTGTIAIAWNSQTANTFLAAPNGSAGAPTFRALAFADVSSFVGSASNTIAAGNDSRFHTQNTDTGTTQQSFQLQSGSAGARIKNNAGVLEVRNSADTAFADIVVRNLTVSGTTTTVNTETVTIADNTISLNSDYSGSTPTENGGIEVNRGSVTAASLVWNESTDLWTAGLAGAEAQLARVFRTTFTNASLTAGVLTVTHNLTTQYVDCLVYDNNNKLVIPDDITFTGANALTVDLTSYGALTGTWRISAIG